MEMEGFKRSCLRRSYESDEKTGHYKFLRKKQQFFFYLVMRKISKERIQLCSENDSQIKTVVRDHTLL